MSTDNSQDSSSIRLRTGHRELAQYSPTPVPQYQNNPLIEALSRILTARETAKLLAHYPELPGDLPAHAPEIRMEMLQAAIQDWYQPTSGTLELARRIASLIRGGYQARNPITPQYQANREADLQRVLSASARPNSRTASLTFRFVGPSGMGKTITTESILGSYTQIIDHTMYKDQPFRFTQLVWVHIDCPFDGSPRGLCLMFLRAVDDILGTNYYTSYTKGRPNTDQLLVAMARVIRNHGVGIIIIDEIQVLRDVKTDGAVQLLNFFVQMVNTLGVPIIFVGTCRASKLFSRAFRQARRGTGQGALDWTPFPKNHPDWQVLLQSLSRYQVMDQRVTNLDQIGEVLHEESVGITDIAVKLWKFAQWRGLAANHKFLTKSLIRSVAKDSLGEARPLLQAFRKKRLSLEALEDLQIMDDETFLKSTKTGKEEAVFQTLLDLLLAQQQQTQGNKDPASASPIESASSTDEQTTDLPSSPCEIAAGPALSTHEDLHGPLLKDIAAEAVRNGQSTIREFCDRGLLPLSDDGACA